jgi:hypothetical protein
VEPRVAWDDLPGPLKQAIEARTGPITGVRIASAGQNSPLAAVSDARDGEVFAKGLPSGHHRVITQAREAEYASSSYGAAKAALAAWTAGLSAEVGPRGLTANVISPGYIAETGFFHGKLTGQRRAALIGATHNGRAGQPGDIAETAYFLASDGARHITGQTLHVNGGAHTTR